MGTQALQQAAYDDMAPQVVEVMKNLGFEQNETQESVTGRQYDKVMGTHLILSNIKTKVKGRIIGKALPPPLNPITAVLPHPRRFSHQSRRLKNLPVPPNLGSGATIPAAQPFSMALGAPPSPTAAAATVVELQRNQQ